MKLPLLLAGLLIIGHCRAQQQVITHWNFNSVPPDNSTSSGSMQPSTGNGVLFSCGTVQFDFASGSGSGDSGSDNTALSLSKFPAQSQGDLSAGVGFGTDLTGFRKISVRADLRLTGTASANYSLQYSLDSGASWISAVPFTSTVAAGNWHKDQLFDLSQIQQLDQCPKARFRFVSTFESGTGKYRPVQSTSTYSSSGTLRVDRLTILGESSIPVIDITPPAVMSILPLDSRRIDIVFNEPLDRKSIHDSCFSGIPGVFNALPASTDSGIYTVSLNFPNGYPQGKYHQLTIRYIADTSGNPMNAGTFPVFHNASRPNVLVSEIMYNNPGTDDYEYLELFNAGADTAFIEAFRMSGVEHRFGGFDLPPGKALLLAKNGPLCTARYGRMFYTWDSGSLSNSGEAIVLYNGGGEMIDSVYYRTTAAWPKMANGNGAALELKTPTGDHTDPKNWRDSFVPQGFMENLPLKGSPGYAWSRNRISFKSDEFFFEEGSGIVGVPLVAKIFDTLPVWIKVSIKNNGIHQLVDTVISIEQPAGNNLHLRIADDNIAWNESSFTVELSDACNGTISGFTSALIRVVDNDRQFPQLCLSECMPQNRNIPDQNGKLFPWIELYNPNEEPVSIGGLILSASTTNTAATHVRLDEALIPSRSFLLWFADSSGGTATHLNLKVPVKNGRIQLLSADGTLVLSSLDYGNTLINKSYGPEELCGDSVVAFPTATPGKGSTGTDIATFAGSDESMILEISNSVIRMRTPGDYTVYTVEGRVARSCVSCDRLDITALDPGVYLIRTKDSRTLRFSKL